MKIYSVTDITKYLKQLFDGDYELSTVYIRGEISNFKKHYSGHCYFTLKDINATIKGIMFRSRAQFLKFQPQDGLKVIAGGRITIFERDGQYQLYVEHLVPEGMGELTLAYEQLKNKLESEGLFSVEKKKSLPLLPKKVGIVTSPTGAAIRDIIKVTKRRHPGIPLVLYPVQVQGTQAGVQIAKAIEFLNKQAQVDVIIVGRGGGSIEELWAFNEEVVVRAIASSAIPIVSAIGHETDYTLSDFAADHRAATPSQAAEIVVPDVKELVRYIYSLRKMLEIHIKNHVTEKNMRLNHSLQHRVFTSPKEFLAIRGQQLDIHIQKLYQELQTQIQNKKSQLFLLAEKLDVLNPLAVLGRGFSLTRSADKKNIVDSRQVVIGETLEVILSKGRLDVQVIKIRSEKNGKEKKSNGN